MAKISTLLTTQSSNNIVIHSCSSPQLDLKQGRNITTQTDTSSDMSDPDKADEIQETATITQETQTEPSLSSSSPTL